jgi:hypothetical protein
MSKPKFTMTSELIKQLQEALDKDGDRPICIHTEFGPISEVVISFQDWGYDNGYYAPDQDDPTNWINSSSPDGITMKEGFYDFCYVLGGRPPECYEDSSVNGRKVREIDPEDSHSKWLDKKQLEEKNMFGGEIVHYDSSKERDNGELDCYPFIAYLKSNGLSAIGDKEGHMSGAKEALKRKYDALKKLKAGEVDPAVLLTSNLRSEREIAKDFLDGKY